MKSEYTVTTVPDNEGEPFEPSSCSCDACHEMHRSNREWETFVPQTALQRRMKAIVLKIEKGIKKRERPQKQKI